MRCSALTLIFCAHAGEQGLGYYRDTPPCAPTEEPKENAPKPAAKPKAIGMNNSIVKGLTLRAGVVKKKKKSGDLRALVALGGAILQSSCRGSQACRGVVLQSGAHLVPGVFLGSWRLTAGSSGPSLSFRCGGGGQAEVHQGDGGLASAGLLGGARHRLPGEMSRLRWFGFYVRFRTAALLLLVRVPAPSSLITLCVLHANVCAVTHLWHCSSHLPDCFLGHRYLAVTHSCYPIHFCR